MFGHDDHDDHNESQITLPPAGDFNQGGQNDQGGQDQPQNDSQPQNDTDLGNFVATESPRKAPKSGAPTDELLDIKQDALQALTPLIDHLEQSPEEKFRTTMMMIQASDNHQLIRIAYEAAHQIKNEKERAQALLDIVNEINYFTQQNQS